MADDMRAALRERAAEAVWDAHEEWVVLNGGYSTSWFTAKESPAFEQSVAATRRSADAVLALLDDWVPRAEHERVAAGAQNVVEQMFTALERSAPAEPGYGETQYRMRVMAEAKTWLAEVRGG